MNTGRYPVADFDKQSFEGIYAAMATAVTADGEVDRDGVKNVANYLLDNGCHGLSILGTTGECNGLRREQRLEVLDTVLEANNERENPGIIMTGAAGTVAEYIIEDLKQMVKPGVVAALVPPPFYYNLDTNGVIEFYENLANESPLPIMMYNIPQTTKVTISPEAVEKLAHHRNIMGIKDSSGNYVGFTHFARIAKQAPGFTLFTGADGTLLGNLLIGGHGIIGGTVNAAPKLEREIFDAFKAGDLENAANRQRILTQVVDVCKIGPGPAGYKAPHYLRGLCGPHMTHPLQWPTDDQLKKIEKGLKEHGVL
jgi:dihydrodipicolinate synthase/N-acetylneuraminate lyase